MRVEGRGRPVCFALAAGHRHESRAFEALFEALMEQGWVQRAHSAGHPRRLPSAVAGDKGYSYPRIRRWCRAARVRAIISTRSDQPHATRFDRRHYRKRNRVERLIGLLKHNRRVATRYEKRAQCYLAMVFLAAIRLWL